MARDGAYNAPSAKTNMSARFCLLGSSSSFKTRIGIKPIIMSVAMFIPALANLCSN